MATVELNNPSAFMRSDQPVYFGFDELGLEGNTEGVDDLGIAVNGVAIPSQLIDRDGDGSKDGIFALVDLAGGEIAEITLAMNADIATQTDKLTQAEISRKVGGEWRTRENKPRLQEYIGGHFENVGALTPPQQHTDHSRFIRYEGPGIESDMIAYRFYLDERNGFDIFGKKTRDMVLHNVGQDGFDTYHEMAPWGMDILKVGGSLGMGGYGFWNGSVVERVSNVDGWTAKVVENGDLYSALQIFYNNWRIADKTVDLTADLSMHGGSRLVHTRLTLSDGLPNIAIGLVKHPGTDFIAGDVNVTGKAYTYVASWGKQSLNDDHLGMALLFRKGDRIEQTTDRHNHVSIMEAAGGDLDYYFLAAWEGEPNGISTQEEFINYLEREAQKLTLQPRERLQTARSQAEKSFPVTARDALSWSQRLADAELDRKTLLYRHDGWDTNRERKPKFEYDIVGLLPMAYDELAKVAPQPRYQKVIHAVTGTFVTDEGEIRRYSESNYNIDNVAPGRVLLRLYEDAGDEKYRIAADRLRHQLKNHPRTSGGAFWHKKKYAWQLWLDGVYMGMPFLARYSQMFENGASLEEVVREFEITRQHLRNADTGLYYHAWDEKKQQNWADPDSGRSAFYWGRGYGWLAMAVVDVLEYIPQDRPDLREPLLTMVAEIAASLERYQDPDTGTWWQIMDRPNAIGNYREASASAMFTYFLAKALNAGYLPERYRRTARAAYEGLIREFVQVHPDGSVSLTDICLVAGLGFGRDGSYRYYMSEPVYRNDPKGTGPFILAGVEMYKLLQSFPQSPM